MWATINKSVWLIVMAFCLGSAQVAQAGTIAPTVADIVVMPGESASVEISIINDQPETTIYSLEPVIVNVEASSEELSIRALSDNEKAWITLSENAIMVEAQQASVVTVSIAPPADLEPQVMIIGVEIMAESTASGGVNVRSGLMSLVFATIGTDIAGQAAILDFEAMPDFTSHLPVEFYLTVENQGERIVQPRGQINIRNLWGQTVAALEINPNEHRLVSGQVRTLEIIWGQEDQTQGFFHELKQELAEWRCGYYRLEAQATPWPGAAELTASSAVIIWPWRTCLVALTVVLLIGVLRKLRH